MQIASRATTAPLQAIVCALSLLWASSCSDDKGFTADDTPTVTADVSTSDASDASVELDAATDGDGSAADDGPAETTDASPETTPTSFADKCASKDLEAGIVRPEGWEAASHCKYAPADYGTLFGESPQVQRMELKMTVAEAAAMKADVDDLMAFFGPGSIPSAWIEACTGFSAGATCTVAEGTGTCLATRTSLVCLAHAFSPPAPLINVCAGVAPGSPCTAFGQTGNCFFDSLNTLFCELEPPAQQNECLGKADGDACALSGLSGSCATSINHSGFSSCAVPGFGIEPLWGVPDDAAAKFFSRKPKYFKTEVVMHGHRWTNVGIRYKGNNGLAESSAPRRPFRLEFDQFEDSEPAIDDQRMFGFKELSFTSNQLDSSFLNQFATATTFGDMGIPTPRATPVVVTLQVGDDAPQSLGLYTMTEVPGKPLLNRYFGEDGGNLYKPDGRGAHFVSFVEASFHKKNNKDAADYSDVVAFIEALHDGVPGEAAWRDDLQARFDMAGFIRFLAVNQAIGNGDTYGRFAHNFYLYAMEDSQRIHFIPWDFDLAFHKMGPIDVSLLSFTGVWPLIQAIVRDPVYYEAYHEELANAYSTLLKDGSLAANLETWRDLVADEATATVGAAQFQGGTLELKAHLEAHTLAVKNYLNTVGFEVP